VSNNIDWPRIGLVNNPFMISPPNNSHNIVWVGMNNLKSEFDSAFTEARGASASQVILCRGPVGGGKTHASWYYSDETHWPTQDPSVNSIKVLRALTPKETSKPDRSFYIDFLESLGLDNVRETVRKAVEVVGIPDAKEMLSRAVVSADLVKAILALGTEEANPILDSYFLNKCSQAELRRIGLSRNIDKSQDYFRVMAGIAQCYIGLLDNNDIVHHSRFCLWIDEMEDFVYYTASQYRPFSQGLRDLVDRLPNFFTLILNFTLSSTEEFEEIEVILGKYLVDRVTRNIFFAELSSEEMLEFVHGQLQIYKTSERDVLANNNYYYPFLDETLKLLFDDMPRRTPRNINKRCRSALLKAFEQGKFAEESPQPLQPDYIRKILQEELDREID
jgi:hypothetical protein